MSLRISLVKNLLHVESLADRLSLSALGNTLVLWFEMPNRSILASRINTDDVSGYG